MVADRDQSAFFPVVDQIGITTKIDQAGFLSRGTGIPATGIVSAINSGEFPGQGLQVFSLLQGKSIDAADIAIATKNYPK